MKFNKLSALAVVALAALTSCSPEQEKFTGAVNTNKGVTVSAQTSFDYNGHVSDTLYVEENAEFVNVPILVQGETNGKVVVTVEVIAGVAKPELDIIPAENVTHYVLTSAVVNIPEGASAGSAEISVKWAPGVIDEHRTLTVKIIDVKGADLVGKGTTVVTILNIDDAYTMMCGNWVMSCRSHATADQANPEKNFAISMVTPSADDPEYGTLLKGYGVRDDNELFMPFVFEYDKDTEEMTVFIPNFYEMADAIWNFGSFYALPISVTSTDDDIPCTADFNSIIADDQTARVDVGLYTYVVGQGFVGTLSGYYGFYSHLNFTR